MSAGCNTSKDRCPRSLFATLLCVAAAGTFLAQSSNAEKLPEGLSRYNPAGLSAEWQYEGVAFFGYPLSTTGADLVPVYRLHNPSRGYLLTASDGESMDALKEGYVREGIAFYAPRKGSIPIYRVRNKRNGCYSYSSKTSGAADPDSSVEGLAFYGVDNGLGGPRASGVPVWRYKNSASDCYLFTASRESPYQVGAFYFGSFSPSASNIINGTRRVYGRQNDWWGGVDDFYGAQPGIPANRRGWDADWSELKPAIGYYNQQSVDVLEEHIQQAADAGLTFFSFYWYWSEAKHSELYPEALTSFLQARNSSRMRFNLTLYAHPWSNDMAITTDNAHAVVDQLVHYFKAPQYLRLPDGRPVFSIGDARNIRPPSGAACTTDQCYLMAIGNFLSLLKIASIKELGVAPFIEIQAGVPAWDKEQDADAITCLVPPFTIAGGTAYPQFTTKIFTQLSGPGKPISPCMLENFDERPRQDILIPDRSAVRYLVGKSNAAFRNNLQVAKDFADKDFVRSGSPASHIVYLYAWNEWHEGGIIEPNAKTGSTTLNIITDVFQLPRVHSRCLDDGQCQVATPGALH
jgi:hypothetical protein